MHQVVVKATPTNANNRISILVPRHFRHPYFLILNHGQAKKVVPEATSISIKKARPTRYVRFGDQ